MKRLYIIFISFVLLFVWFTFAADFDVEVTPNNQHAISGSVLSFDIVATNNSWTDVYVQQEFPNFVNYVDSNVVPNNISALTLWLANDPYWTLSAGQSISLEIEAVFEWRSFPTPTLDVITNIIDTPFVSVYTSSVVKLEAISDIVVGKTLVWSGPKLSGDIVTYNIEVKNVWSKIATWISLVDVWPANMLEFPNQAIVGGSQQVPTIYNWQVNNYLFTINDLAPYATSIIEIEWTLLDSFPVGQTIENRAFVLVESDQYTTENDSDTLINEVLGFADIMVDVLQTSPNPMFSWDEVWYLISYANIGSETGVDVFLDSTLSNNMLFESSTPSPTNSLTNSIQWNLGILSPNQIWEIVMTWVFLWEDPFGSEISNSVYVVTNSQEHYTDNNSAISTWEMQAYFDMNIDLYANNLTNPSLNFDTGTQIFAVSGDLIELQILVNNSGNIVTTWDLSLYNITWFAEYIGLNSWDITILPWWQDSIFVTWIVGPQNYMSFVPTVDLNYNNLSISENIDIQEPLECGDGLLTQDEICEVVWQLWNIPAWQHCEEQNWQCVLVDNLYIDLYANNLTDSTRNFDTGTQIFAISGDMVELMVVVENDWVDSESWVVNISNINWFVNYLWFTSWNVNVASWSSEIITITWIVGPQNYISFNPVANLNYSGSLISDDVVIEEPLECGDGLITQDEVCDTNGQIWNMLPWQHCEEQNWQCVVVTETLTNTVCIEYVSDFGTGEQCMSVTIDYDEEDLWAQCRYLSSPYGVVIVDEDNEWDMDFTCVTENWEIADEIRIDCGNWDYWIANAVDSFTYNCGYEYDQNWWLESNLYDVQCYVDDHTCEDCHRIARVDEWFYGVCGDGSLDDGEECDLGWDEDEEIDIERYLDLDRDYDAWRYEDNGYYCEDCRIRRDDTDEFVYQPPQCLGTNTTISVMENEYLPFRWRLRERDNLRIRDNYDCEDNNDNDQTIIDKDSMECTFVIYNHDDEVWRLDDADCFARSDSQLFDYFELEDYDIDFDKVSGRYTYSIDSLFDRAVKEYWEYKLVLEKVEYDYCDPNEWDWEKWRLYEWVCEVNFALTRPYMMQISTFGVQPVATDADFLEDFYDMEGNDLIESTDIRDTMEVEKRNYGFDSSVLTQMNTFRDKYESLSLVVDNNFEIRNGKTVWDLFNDAEVKKVPNQLIFFVKGGGKLVLKQLTEYFPGTPFTIYIEWMDVIVEWSVTTNGMIITDQKIYFEDSSDLDYCEKWWQVVKWIFVTQWWFDSETRLRNQNTDEERCPWWNLQVKWVLIWDDLEALMWNRRSHLNDWFQVDSNLESAIKRERRDEIFEGAALLIEYNPDLWENLPPGAESFTQTLDVYRY